MPFFATAKPAQKRDGKIAALKAMSLAELADIGLKPGDVARLEREMKAGR